MLNFIAHGAAAVATALISFGLPKVLIVLVLALLAGLLTADADTIV
ncbi:MAG TPA: hypothetical protein VNH11_30165 [Pirellulales bacterium]|nr:hypothetical protein [Pirellulales bacterium]